MGGKIGKKWISFLKERERKEGRRDRIENKERNKVMTGTDLSIQKKNKRAKLLLLETKKEEKEQKKRWKRTEKIEKDVRERRKK